MARSRIEEMLVSPIREMQALGKTLRAEEQRKCNLHLDYARRIQEAHPEVILGGSASLYIHGVRLARHKKYASSDLDLIVPYYIEFYNIGDLSFSPQDEMTPTEDFDYRLKCNSVGIDVRIDPKRPWEYIELDDFKYKVSYPEHTIMAKIRYAMNGNKKHKNDIYEMIGKIVVNENEVVKDSIWEGS